LETIIIDTNNLLHKVGSLKKLLNQDKDVAVDTMIARMQSNFPNKAVKIVLVFDGYGKNRNIGNIEAKFSKTNVVKFENADELIKSLIDRARNSKLLRIVTSDNEIAWYARNSGCKIQSSSGFWSELKDKKIQQRVREGDVNEKPQFSSRVEYDYLLKEFTKKKK